MLKMLEASRKNNISLNSEKLRFKQQKVDFYGHRLSGKEIQPSEDKLQAIKNIKTPTNPKELQQIDGTAKKTFAERGLLQMERNASSSPGLDKERTVRCQNNVILQPRQRSEDNSTVWRQSTGFRSLVTTDRQRWHRKNCCHVFKVAGGCRNTLLKHRERERVCVLQSS